MGRPKGSKNKVQKSSRGSPSKRVEEDSTYTLNTPNHYSSLDTPKPLQQYTTPAGLEQELSSPRKNRDVTTTLAKLAQITY